VHIEAAGNVLPRNTVELRPQVATTVRSIAVKEGQFVRQGDLLFTFDDRADQANLQKAEASLLRDRATQTDLERQWARARDLQAQNFIAPSAADSVLSQLDAQRALVAADQAAVRSAEVALSFNRLTAPMSGRTGAITVNPGSLVQPSGAALVTIAQVDPISVSFSLPEAQLSALLVGGAGANQADKADQLDRSAKGARVQVGVPGSEPPLVLDGVVSFIDNSVDTSTGTIRVKAQLANPRQQLWPGQYVPVRLILRVLKDAAVLPQAALILRGEERQVYVVGGDGLAELRTVRVRFSAGDSVAVEGVQAGERVVVEGKQNLRPGSAVKETVAAAATAASTAPAAGSGVSQ